MITRSQVSTFKPNPRFHGHTSHISPLPKSLSVALSDPHWRDAMYDEYNVLIKNDTWILVPKPPNVNVVQSMWLFRHKYYADVYALRVGFTSSRCDSSLFIYQHGTEVAYLLIYVDDIVLAASSTDLLQRIISSLHKEFDLTDLGALNYFLGISVTRDAKGMTPVDTESKLGSDRDPVFDSTLYHSLAGGLQIIFYLGSAKHQVPLSHSSAEAKYRVVVNVVAETAWICNLLQELHTPLFTATLVYLNNVRCDILCYNPCLHRVPNT
ncbi:ribonuclease H-like domain-containing protein [Tanacetum coccineum]